MAGYRALHQKIVDKLTADSTLVSQVNYAHTRFDSYPAIAVANASNANFYQSNLANRRQYAYSVYCYYLFKGNSEYENAVKAVEDVMDEVLAIFNDRAALQPEALVSEPVPSSIVSVDAGDEGVYIIGEIIVQAQVYEDC